MLALPARAEQLSLKAGAALLQVEPTATMEHDNKWGVGAQESKGQVCKDVRGTKDADQDLESPAAASCLCAQGPGKSPLHLHFGYLNTFKLCSW